MRNSAILLLVLLAVWGKFYLAAPPDITGTWTFGHEGNLVSVKFEEDEHGLSGTAVLSEEQRAREGFVSATGTVSGKFSRKNVDFTIEWQAKNGSTCTWRYSGTWLGDTMKGRCWDSRYVYPTMKSMAWEARFQPTQSSSK